MTLWGNSAWAGEFRSVGSSAAILYDAPSKKGKRLYLMRPGTPVELLVRLDGWSKVRDAEGAILWLESKDLLEQRTLVVIAQGTELRQAPTSDAAVLARLDKSVGLNFQAVAQAGWVEVSHVQGQKGFVRMNQVWGL